MFGNNDKIVIGYDISNQYAQISFCRQDGDNVQTYSMTEGTEEYNIPLCLFKRKEVNQWFLADEALHFVGAEPGYFFEDILEKALSGEEFSAGEETFNASALLSLFIKRSLSLLVGAGRKEKICGIMFTIPSLTEKAIEVLNEIMLLLDMKDCIIAFQGREESIYYYMIHQPEQIWNYDVCVYDLSKTFLNSYTFTRNQHTTPQVVFINKEEFPDVTKTDSVKNDESFKDIIIKTTEGKVVSGAFLIGDGFLGDWCKLSLQELCRNRRVFKGNNLYSRGACYAMLHKTATKKAEESIVFLGEDKLKANVGMQIRRKGAEPYLALLSAGENWYDCKKECDIILLTQNSFFILITPLDGRNVKKIEVVLDGLPIREEGTTRLHLFLSMESENILKLLVTDMGFGELVPGSGQVFEQKISIG